MLFNKIKARFKARDEPNNKSYSMPSTRQQKREIEAYFGSNDFQEKFTEKILNIAKNTVANYFHDVRALEKLDNSYKEFKNLDFLLFLPYLASLLIKHGELIVFEYNKRLRVAISGNFEIEETDSGQIRYSNINYLKHNNKSVAFSGSKLYSEETSSYIGSLAEKHVAYFSQEILNFDNISKNLYDMLLSGGFNSIYHDLIPEYAIINKHENIDGKYNDPIQRNDDETMTMTDTERWLEETGQYVRDTIDAKKGFKVLLFGKGEEIKNMKNNSALRTDLLVRAINALENKILQSIYIPTKGTKEEWELFNKFIAFPLLNTLALQVSRGSKVIIGSEKYIKLFTKYNIQDVNNSARFGIISPNEGRILTYGFDLIENERMNTARPAYDYTNDNNSNTEEGD